MNSFSSYFILDVFHYHSRKNIGDQWKKYLGERLINLQLFIVWVLPLLCWISIWFQEDVTYDVSFGEEDGRVCYPYSTENGEQRILFTYLQYLMLIVTDSLVFTSIIISGAIVFFRLKIRAAKDIEKEENNPVKILATEVIKKAKIKILNKTMGWVIGAFVILRLPFFIIASIAGMNVEDSFNWYFRVALILYVARFSVMPIMLAKFNDNAKKACSDLMKPLTPKCLEKTNLKRACYNNFVGCCKR